MALSSPDIALIGSRLACCVLALLVLTAAEAEPGAGPAAPPGASDTGPPAEAATAQLTTNRGVIKVEMSKSEVDGKSHQMVLHNVVVSQGDLKVTADRADGTALAKDSHWVFTGNVFISAEARGTVRSERATVELKNGVIARAVATGSPAEFVQTGPDTAQLAHGHADSIDYSVTAGTVQLTGNASVTQPGRKFDAAVIIYNIREQTVQAEDGGEGRRVEITIDPKQDAKREPKP